MYKRQDRVPSVAEATGEVADLLPPYEAVSFRSALTAAEAERSVEVPVSLPQPGEYLLEPAPAIVRSHLVAEFAQSIGAQLLDEHLAYLRSAEPVEHPLVTCYEVLEEIPLQEKQLKRWVREQGFTALTIKKRGVDIVPEQLRARLLGSAGSKPVSYTHLDVYKRQHGVGAGHQGLANLTGVLHTAVGNHGNTGGDSCLSGLVDRGHLGHAHARNNAGGADGAGAHANLHGVGAGVDDGLSTLAGCGLTADNVHVLSLIHI